MTFIDLRSTNPFSFINFAHRLDCPFKDTYLFVFKTLKSFPPKLSKKPLPSPDCYLPPSPAKTWSLSSSRLSSHEMFHPRPLCLRGGVVPHTLLCNLLFAQRLTSARRVLCLCLNTSASLYRMNVLSSAIRAFGLSGQVILICLE